MYVTEGCNLPNSETPLTPAEIAAQDERVAAVGKIFEDGNETMQRLIDGLIYSSPGGPAAASSAGKTGDPGAPPDASTAANADPLGKTRVDYHALVPTCPCPGLGGPAGAPGAAGQVVADMVGSGKFWLTVAALGGLAFFGWAVEQNGRGR
jgi:hypothetical protein